MDGSLSPAKRMYLADDFAKGAKVLVGADSLRQSRHSGTGVQAAPPEIALVIGPVNLNKPRWWGPHLRGAFGIGTKQGSCVWVLGGARNMACHCHLLRPKSTPR